MDVEYVAKFSHYIPISQVTCQNEWLHYGAQARVRKAWRKGGRDFMIVCQPVMSIIQFDAKFLREKKQAGEEVSIEP